MDFNITLGVSQEELAEFPDTQEPTGIVVPTGQDSLPTTSITEENTPKEETTEERGTPLTTESSSQRSNLPCIQWPLQALTIKIRALSS